MIVRLEDFAEVVGDRVLEGGDGLVRQDDFARQRHTPLRRDDAPPVHKDTQHPSPRNNPSAITSALATLFHRRATLLHGRAAYIPIHYMASGPHTIRAGRILFARAAYYSRGPQITN